jgi:hypothetical protein
VNLLDELRDRYRCIVVGEALEPVEHLARDDFLARARNEPVVQKDR